MVAKVPPAGITTYKGTPSAGDLGVGLHIKTADSGASVNSAADEIIVEGSGSSGISILSGTSNEGSIKFGDSGDNDIGYISYNHSTNATVFGTNGASQWAIDSAGNLLPSATDHGIYLGVTSATAANHLDDYEEGTWTLAVNDGTNTATHDGNGNTGTYVKVGNVVHLTGYVLLTSLGSVSGNVYLGTFPFTVLGNNRNYSAFNITYAAGLSTTAGYNMGGYAVINNTVALIQRWDAAGGTTNMTTAEITADAQFIFNITYMTA